MWAYLNERLNEAYKNEEIYWCQKSRIQWLKDREKNSKFFHAYTVQRRKMNNIVRLNSSGGDICESKKGMEE